MLDNAPERKRRVGCLFGDDGRSLVVAIDHGGGIHVYPELADPGRVIAQVAEGGADAILANPGAVRRYATELKSLGVILRMDGGASLLSKTPESRLLYSVEDALRLGADAVACMGFPGTPLEGHTLANLANLAGQCQNWGMPLMAEVLPGGFTHMELRTPENVQLAARIGVELGADLIKTEFTGSEDSFKAVVENCFRPVLVLGGSKLDDESALFRMVRSALNAGAVGAVIGRNVWGHRNPRAFVEALSHLVHGDASVEETLEVFKSARA